MNLKNLYWVEFLKCLSSQHNRDPKKKYRHNGHEGNARTLAVLQNLRSSALFSFFSYLRVTDHHGDL